MVIASTEIHHAAANECEQSHPNSTQATTNEDSQGCQSQTGANATTLPIDRERPPATPRALPKALNISHLTSKLLSPFTSLYLFCLFTSCSLLIPPKKRNPPPNTPTPPSAGLPTHIYRHIQSQLRITLGPTLFWGPSAILALAIIVTRTLAFQDYQPPSYGNTVEFTSGCPLGGRRTRTSAFVKLFAAAVTTVAIQGHLGSLQGSRTWNWELLRVVDVVFAPLKTVYTLMRTV